jgi:hypothetical protein
VLGYNVGYPFVVLAPRAHVAATELLITGAIYARRFTGAWDFQAMRPDFTRHVPTAQVNGVRPHELFGIGVSLKPPATGR